jgi:oligosaccharide repeat unit polymerase
MDRPNRDRSNLLEALAITASAVILLIWQEAHFSPAGMLFLGLLVLSYLNYKVGKLDVLYPAFTFTAVWTAVVAVYLVCPLEIRPLGCKTTAVILGGMTFFSAGSLLGNRPIYSRGCQARKNSEGADQDNPQLRIALLAYILLALPAVIVHARDLVGGESFLSPEFFIDMRFQLVSMALEGEAAHTNKFILSVFTVGSLTYLVFLLEERRKWLQVLCGLYMAILILVNTSRAFLMWAVCAWLCAALLGRRKRSFSRVIRWVSAICVGSLIMMASLKFLTKAQTEGGNALEEAADLTVIYIAGPVAGFDYIVYHPGEFRGQPALVFQGVRTRLSRLNLIRATPRESAYDPVYVPFGMVVYTCFAPYYVEFGVLGCLLTFGVIGVMEGQIFFNAMNGSRVARFLLAYSAYALMTSTFDDHFATQDNEIGFMYACVFAAGYFLITKHVRFRIFKNMSRMESSPLISAQE